MIVVNEVEILVVNRLLKYFRELGYKCNSKDTIKVKVTDLKTNSKVIITQKCDYCEDISDITYAAYTKSLNSNGKKSCNKCKNIKTEETNIKKYGVKRPIQNKEIMNKVINTNIQKYGEFTYTKTDKCKTHLSKIFKDRYIDKISNLNIGKYLSSNIDGSYNIECNICNNIFILNNITMSSRIAKNNTPCYHCVPLYKTNAEVNIVNYIKSLNSNIEIITNSRKIIKGLELDIYLPEYKIAIEYNGLYWHSDLYKNKNYHLNKTNKCAEKNIRLIHIWEDDWINKNIIIKNIIKNALSLNSKKIFARKCTVKLVDKDIAKIFFNNYHIQQHRNSKYYYGLYHNNELITMASFKDNSSPFINNKNNIPELIRFCTKFDINVIGGLSKIISAFLKDTNNTKIISYMDKSIFNGNGYLKAGFKHISNSIPGYSYIINNIFKRHHRYNFRKDILIKKGYDKNKPETQIMSELGYNKIYDCGQMKMIYDTTIKK